MPGLAPFDEAWLSYLDLASRLLVVFAAAGFMLSLIVFIRNRRNERSSVFLSLRGDYSRVLETLQRDLPDHNSEHPLITYESVTLDAKQALRGYWVHSLNEFVITNVLHRGDALGLWRDFYARAQSSALDMPLFRAALDDLIKDENYSFGGHKAAYLCALETAYRTHRSGKLRLPRQTDRGEGADAIARATGNAAALGQRLLRRLRAGLDERRVPNEFRDLVDDAERLLQADTDATYQAQCLAACLALEAAAEGDFGVGAVLADPTGRIIGMARNTVFSSRDTSCHAEMNIISGHHIDRLSFTQNDASLGRVTLISSLEPCPMCLSRISMTPLRDILYHSPDPEGGMVARKDALPEVWQGFLRNKSFALTSHTPLAAFAGRVFEATRAKDARLSH